MGFSVRFSVNSLNRSGTFCAFDRTEGSWRHGDMETRRHGDTETRRHGDTETWRHGFQDQNDFHYEQNDSQDSWRVPFYQRLLTFWSFFLYSSSSSYFFAAMLRRNPKRRKEIQFEPTDNFRFLGSTSSCRHEAEVDPYWFDNYPRRSANFRQHAAELQRHSWSIRPGFLKIWKS